jgi:hypothetical protein
VCWVAACGPGEDEAGWSAVVGGGCSCGLQGQEASGEPRFFFSVLLCEEILTRLVAQEDYEFGDVLGEGAFGAVSGAR